MDRNRPYPTKKGGPASIRTRFNPLARPDFERISYPQGAVFWRSEWQRGSGAWIEKKSCGVPMKDSGEEAAGVDCESSLSSGRIRSTIRRSLAGDGA